MSKLGPAARLPPRGASPAASLPLVLTSVWKGTGPLTGPGDEGRPGQGQALLGVLWWAPRVVSGWVEGAAGASLTLGSGSVCFRVAWEVLSVPSAHLMGTGPRFAGFFGS